MARLRLDDLVRMSRNAEGRLRWASTRARVLGPLWRSLRPHAEPLHPLEAYGLRSPGTKPQQGRSGYLAWLSRSATGLPAAGNPAAMGGLLQADPFSARTVLAIAAAIVPPEWQVGGTTRSFARRAGEGRVPDAIRLKTGRGSQGRDSWFVVRHDRDEYLDRVSRIRDVPGLHDLDVRGIASMVAGWPWLSPIGPPWPQHVSVDRLLSAAEFHDTWNAATSHVP